MRLSPPPLPSSPPLFPARQNVDLHNSQDKRGAKTESPSSFPSLPPLSWLRSQACTVSCDWMKRVWRGVGKGTFLSNGDISIFLPFHSDFGVFSLPLPSLLFLFVAHIWHAVICEFSWWEVPRKKPAEEGWLTSAINLKERKIFYFETFFMTLHILIHQETSHDVQALQNNTLGLDRSPHFPLSSSFLIYVACCLAFFFFCRN